MANRALPSLGTQFIAAGVLVAFGLAMLIPFLWLVGSPILVGAAVLIATPIAVLTSRLETNTPAQSTGVTVPQAVAASLSTVVGGVILPRLFPGQSQTFVILAVFGAFATGLTVGILLIVVNRARRAAAADSGR